MENDKDLIEIFEDDPLGLLNVKPKQSSAVPSNERLVASFHAINEFVEKNGREPEPGKGVQEHQLYARLKGIRESKEKIQALVDLDEHELLKDQAKEIESLEDLLESDALGILDSGAESIFDIKHVPKETTMPDYVASRKKCKDFDEYEGTFIKCQAELKSGKRRLMEFKNEQQIQTGYFFVLKGILLYVASVGDVEKNNGKKNARLRCIFENGTESDMLLRSLAAELYKDGRRVTESEDSLLDSFHNITDEDQETGIIYILRSLSEKPEIKEIENLYKVGFSRTSIEERIKNAASDPTYLMAPVSVVATVKCFNMNPQKLEKLLHHFFGGARLELDIFDKNGKRHSPREWIVAPYEIIDKAIDLIVADKALNYRYDREMGAIIDC